MSLEHDPRTGTEDSAHITIVQADADAPQTGYDVPDGALFKPTAVKVEYNDAATVDTELQMHDSPVGTANADLDDPRDTWANISPGARIETDGTYRPVEEAALFTADGTQDGDLEITVHGVLLTDLKDVSSA